MARTLVYVPRMFTREEFKELVGEVPEDFDRTAEEFWNYVSERLRSVASKIRWVYSDSFPEGEGKKTSQGEEVEVVRALAGSGAQLRAVGDPILVGEVKAWLELSRTSSNQVVLDLYRESLKEVGAHIVNVICQTLKDGEMGVLFVDPGLKISFPGEVRVIRMLPFDPQDYLNRHRVRLGK